MTLALRHVSLSLGGRPVLRDIALSFAPGRVCAILGPNGAGKSSLLRCMAGLESPAGAVELDGAPLAALPLRARARAIGYLAQQAEVSWDIDVETLVSLGRLPWRDADDGSAIAEAMAETGTTAFARRRLSTLSGGERARALFARVLAGRPRWILADEPLAALDPAYQLQLATLLRAAAARGAGVAVVLHDLNMAARMADDVALLRQGALLAAGPRDSTLTAARAGELFGTPFTALAGFAGPRLLFPD